MLFLHYNFSQEPLHNRERLNGREEFTVLLPSLCFTASTTNPELSMLPGACLFTCLYFLPHVALSRLHLITHERCRCFHCTPCTGPGSRTGWSCEANTSSLTCSVSTTTPPPLLHWPFKRAHLEEFVHNSTLHLSKEEPCLRAKGIYFYKVKETA